ncbi:chemotaxis protein CheB [Trichocoleus sp. FACHB-262]|nr:chemotaxis protein CheB [Trichocoleus sp. FACHB-262]
MNHCNLVVVGTSAGGLEVLRSLVKHLPPDFPAAICIVWHLPPDAQGILPRVLDKAGPLKAAHAIDREAIVPGRIYVAPPNHHLLIEPERVRVTKGPKENRFRPAIDPLFRSAAYVYGAGAIGIVLTGALDDGTSGLWTIKLRGGTTIVQHPQEALIPSMPKSALKEVEVDYCVPVAMMPELLIRLTQEPVASMPEVSPEENEKTQLEIQTAAEENALQLGIMKLGELSAFTCPECHGVLVKIKEGNITRFRCHTGHAFSANALLSEVTHSIEETLWSALRAVEESVMLLENLGEHLAEAETSELAQLYLQKAQEAKQRADLVRQAVMQHEQFSVDTLRQQTEEGHF